MSRRPANGECLVTRSQLFTAIRSISARTLEPRPGRECSFRCDPAMRMTRSDRYSPGSIGLA
jgi:hypothetical protein